MVQIPGTTGSPLFHSADIVQIVQTSQVILLLLLKMTSNNFTQILGREYIQVRPDFRTNVNISSAFDLRTRFCNYQDRNCYSKAGIDDISVYGAYPDNPNEGDTTETTSFNNITFQGNPNYDPNEGYYFNDGGIEEVRNKRQDVIDLIDLLSYEKEIIVYPDPAKDKVVIFFPVASSIKSIVVEDLQGSVLDKFERNITKSSLENRYTTIPCWVIFSRNN